MRRFIVLGLLATAGHASAFELKKDEAGRAVRWADGAVTFAMNASGARDLPLAEAEQAVVGAFRAWSGVPGVDLRLDYQGRVEGLRAGYDRYDPDGNRNAVVWSGDEWTYEDDALAITLSLFRVSTGELVDADIVVNEKSYRWGAGAEAENDLQNTLAHEVGHFIGLAHSDVEGSTMYPHAHPYETEKRDLHADDQAGVRALYPSTSAAPVVAAPAARYGGAHRDDAVEAPPRSAEAGAAGQAIAPNLSCSAATGSSSVGFWTLLMVLGLRGARRRPRRNKGE